MSNISGATRTLALDASKPLDLVELASWSTFFGNAGLTVFLVCVWSCFFIKWFWKIFSRICCYQFFCSPRFYSGINSFTFHLRAIWALTHFMPRISFDIPRKHQKNSGFLMFLGGIKRDHGFNAIRHWSVMSENRLRWPLKWNLNFKNTHH